MGKDKLMNQEKLQSGRKEAIEGFAVDGTFRECTSCGNGHINDTYMMSFRAVGIIMGIVLYLIARFQHRYNMPSFRDPQFERIRKYLENDEL